MRASASREKRKPLIAAWLSALLLLAAWDLSCAKPKQEKPQEPESKGRHVYKDIKPDTYPLPPELRKIFPGLLNDNIYLYRDLTPVTLNLVSYEENYSLLSAVKQCARGFEVLAQNPEFRKKVSFWIIQVQPKPDQESKAEREKEESQVLVWGVRPEEVDRYRETKDLKAFIRDSEYMLINDKIIPKGQKRLAFFPELEEQEPRKPAGTAPSPGAGETEKPTTAPPGGAPNPNPR